MFGPTDGTAKGPLDGVRVLDLSRVLAGPLCAMLLGDLGADVVKVERPGVGDDTRGWGPPFVADEAAYYLGVNRNKRSITLDISRPEGRAVVQRMAESSDVLVDNFKTSDLAKFGLDEDWRLRSAPHLVHVHIAGYGAGGPWEARPGYDFIIQAEAGLMSITGGIDQGPTKWGVAMVDYCTGQSAALAAVSAYVARLRSGAGQRVDLSLHETGLAMLSNVAYNQLVSGNPARKYGNGHPNIVPYRSFRASDGEFALAVGNDAQFAKLASALGHPEWAQDARYATNAGRVRHRDEVDDIVAAVLSTESRGHWAELFTQVGVPSGSINSVEEALRTDHAVARGVVQQVPHPTIGSLPMLRPSFDLGLTPATIRRPPPLLGEHTDDVLAETGYSPDDITSLRTAGIV